MLVVELWKVSSCSHSINLFWIWTNSNSNYFGNEATFFEHTHTQSNNQKTLFNQIFTDPNLEVRSSARQIGSCNGLSFSVNIYWKIMRVEGWFKGSLHGSWLFTSELWRGSPLDGTDGAFPDAGDFSFRKWSVCCVWVKNSLSWQLFWRFGFLWTKNQRFCCFSFSFVRICCLSWFNVKIDQQFWGQICNSKAPTWEVLQALYCVLVILQLGIDCLIEKCYLQPKSSLLMFTLL